MDLQLVDVIGKVDRKSVLLNTEEYAYISGSHLIIKQFKSSYEKANKYLK
jgi:hypothetical protein